MSIASTQIAATAGAAPPHNGFSLISNDKLLQLYATMLKSRMLHERILTVTRQNGSTQPLASIGMVAAAAGVGVDLLPGDTLAPSPSGFIPCFVKGIPLDRIFSALSLAGARGRSRYAPLNVIPPSLSLAAQLDKAIGAAKANKAGRNKKIVVAFSGDLGESQSELLKAMRVAGARKLPMLLICHGVPEGEEICLKAEERGFPGVTVDGDDAVAVYRVATEAIAHARRGNGSTLIECKHWPLAGAEAGKRRKPADPILNMEAYLVRKGLFDKKFKSAVAAGFRRELDAAIQITHRVAVHTQS